MPLYNMSDLNSAWALVEDTGIHVNIEYDPTVQGVTVHFRDFDGFTGEGLDRELGKAIEKAHSDYMRNLDRNT